MLQGVKNIVFDLGGVIINLNQDLTHRAFQQLFPDNFESMYQEMLSINLFEEYEVGNISSLEFIAQFQKFNSSITIQEIEKAWNSMLLDIPKERMQLIAQLRTNYRVFLLSNTNEIHFNYIHQYAQGTLGIADFKQQFEYAYLSHEVKMRKPSVHIFQYVLGHSKLIPEETLFIDDTLEHILTAKQLGIKTLHLNLKQNQTLTQLLNEH